MPRAELTPEVTAFTPFALTELTVGDDIAIAAPSPTPRGKREDLLLFLFPANQP